MCIENFKNWKEDKKEWEKTKKPLAQYVKIYKKVFGGEPYNEKWTTKDVFENFKDELEEQEANIFVLKDEQENNVGISSAYWLKKEIGGKEIFGLYISEIAVLEEFRGNGYGKKLFEKQIEFAKNNNIEKVFFRTKKEESMSAPVAEKLGFKIIENSETKTDIEEQNYINVYYNLDVKNF